jgi:hypothetical protein
MGVTYSYPPTGPISAKVETPSEAPTPGRAHDHRAAERHVEVVAVLGVRAACGALTS